MSVLLEYNDWPDNCCLIFILGLHSRKVSYHKLSRRSGATMYKLRVVWSLWNWTGVSRPALQSNVRTIHVFRYSFSQEFAKSGGQVFYRLVNKALRMFRVSRLADESGARLWNSCHCNTHWKGQKSQITRALDEVIKVALCKAHTTFFRLSCNYLFHFSVDALCI